MFQNLESLIFRNSLQASPNYVHLLSQYKSRRKHFPLFFQGVNYATMDLLPNFAASNHFCHRRPLTTYQANNASDLNKAFFGYDFLTPALVNVLSICSFRIIYLICFL